MCPWECVWLFLPGRYIISYSYPLNSILHRWALLFLIFLSLLARNIWLTACWSVTIVNHCPDKLWDHFLAASVIVLASFWTYACLRSVGVSVRKKKATGRPAWFSVAAIAVSDASVSDASVSDASVSITRGIFFIYGTHKCLSDFLLEVDECFLCFLVGRKCFSCH